MVLSLVRRCAVTRGSDPPGFFRGGTVTDLELLTKQAFRESQLWRLGMTYKAAMDTPYLRMALTMAAKDKTCPRPGTPQRVRQMELI